MAIAHQHCRAFGFATLSWALRALDSLGGLMDAPGLPARRRLGIRHVLETGRTAEFEGWRFIAVIDAKPN
jgi:hypothetical protein